MSTEAAAPAGPSAAKLEVAEDHTRIRGTLLGHDGQPLALAEARVSVPGQPELEVPVAADGEFSFELEQPGWVSVRLSGINHAEHTVEFLATGGAHDLDVRLGTYARPEQLEALFGFGSFDGEGRDVQLTFSRRDDGTWAAKFARGEDGAAAKQLHYQIANATSEGRTMNGTQADRYVYDGGGDYFSVVELGEGEEFEIVWDPAAMPPGGRVFSLEFGEPGSSLARTAALSERIVELRDDAFELARTAAATSSPGDALANARAQLRQQFSQTAEAESDPILRRMWMVAWASVLEDEPSAAQRAEFGPQVAKILAEVGPRDPLWSMLDWSMAWALAQVDDPQYFALAAAEHPDADVVAGLWLSVLIAADKAGELERGREAMAALTGPRLAETELAELAGMYSPDRLTAPGRPVPEFRLTSVDGKTEFTPSDLRGKTYVLDFWATWCGPCIAELPRLHAAYASIHGQAPVEGRKYGPVAKPKLELISISLDHDPKIVAKFRKEQWPMPWSHVVADEATHKLLSQSFGIVGIPTMVLVGPDGTILASSPRLDGGNLGEIAGEFLP